jgi:hypothetical protein
MSHIGNLDIAHPFSVSRACFVITGAILTWCDDLWEIRPDVFSFLRFDLFCGLQAAILKIRLCHLKANGWS